MRSGRGGVDESNEITSDVSVTTVRRAGVWRCEVQTDIDAH